MKKLLLIISLFAFSFSHAKLCSKGCNSGAYGVGYAWYQPDGTACGGAPLSSDATVYYAYALSDGDGGAVVVETGTTCSTCIGC